MQPHDSLRAQARAMDDSGIVAILNHCGACPDIARLWVGEGDLPTPQFICDAANRSMTAGETFYTWQRGIPELRQALAEYHEAHYGIANDPERFFVTGSGMQAIQLAVQAVAGEGDEVVMTAPCWPNIHEAVKIMGARPVQVRLDFSENGWSLDTQKLFDSVSERTRALFINSPANPTGWMADSGTLEDLLHFARDRGLWIIADEVYGRYTYDRERAPSFYDHIEPDDRVIFVNTFSKNWAMTGWRIGWISAPPSLGQVFENLIQYSTSGVPAFNQRAAIAALTEGEEFFQMQRARARRNRDILCDTLRASEKARFAKPEAALYLFFAVDGFSDSTKLALRLIDEAKLGMAPGSAFYEGGEGFLRLCFLRDPEQIEAAASALGNWLEKQ